jgi:hypothetical protein
VLKFLRRAKVEPALLVQVTEPLPLARGGVLPLALAHEHDLVVLPVFCFLETANLLLRPLLI